MKKYNDLSVRTRQKWSGYCEGSLSGCWTSPLNTLGATLNAIIPSLQRVQPGWVHLEQWSPVKLAPDLTAPVYISQP